MVSLLTLLGATETTVFGTGQGVLVGCIAALSLLLIHRLPKWKWTAAALVLIALAPLATLGFWYSSGSLGISDWDYYFSLHTTNRATLLTYHELPQWNPYICGGTAGIADPEFRFFTPTFLLQLAFGIPVGFRLAIWLATATGAVGMLVLGKRLKLSLNASYLAGIIATFGSVTLLEIVEGHPNVFAAMFIPWIFWAWLGAYRAVSKRSLWHIITGAILALTFFQGGIYLLMYTAIAFLVLPLTTKNILQAYRTSIVSGLWGLGFAAIKIIPVFLWLSQFQDNAYASSALTLPYLDTILFGRYLHGVEDVIPNQGGGWHEYGAYIGIPAAVLAVIGAIFGWRKRIVRSLLIATVLAIVLSGSGPILKPLFDQVSILPRSNISRAILFAVIPLSLLAGFGLDRIRHSLRRYPWIMTVVTIGVVLVVSVDLMSLSYPLSEQAFVLPHVVPAIPKAPSPIGYTLFNYKTRHDGVDYNRAYDATLEGYGTFAYCSVLGPAGGAEGGNVFVRTIHDEEDKDIVSVKSAEGKGTFNLISWTPNTVVVDVTAPDKADIVLNANYAKGWYANGQPAKEIAGRVAMSVPEAGAYHVIFTYRTPGLPLGTFVSAVSIGLASYLLWRRKRQI